MDLLERPVAGLWDVKPGEYRQERIRAEPDVAVFGAPVEVGWVDKVRGGECAQPVSEKVEGGGEAEYVAAERGVRVFAAEKPGVGS